MGRVLTNNSAMAFAVQPAFDNFTTAVGDWMQLEFNELTSIGPDISTVARNPISKERGARQGTITDLDAAVEFSTDVTFDLIRNFIESFAYVKGVNADVTQQANIGVSSAQVKGLLGITTVVAAGTGYAVGDLLNLTISPATAIRQPVLRVVTITGGGSVGPIGTLAIADPGLYVGALVLTANVLITVTGSGSSATATVTEQTNTTVREQLSTLGTLTAGGIDFAVGDLLSIDETGLTNVERSPVLRVETIGALDAITLLSIFDHGAFSGVLDVTANALTGGSGTGATTDLNAATDIISYKVPGLLAGAAGKLNYTKGQNASLVFGRGFSQSSNTGLKAIGATTATSDREVYVTDQLVTEVSLFTANSSLELAGLRTFANASGDFTWSWNAGLKQATLTSAADITDFTVFGMAIGQFVHVGSGVAGAVVNAFENSAANDMFGYARVVSFGAGTVVFDKVDAALQFNDAVAPITAVDILFGIFVRNVATDDASFTEEIYLIEAASPNLFETDPPTPVTNPDGFEYMVNTYPNQFAWALPITDKSTATLSFVSTDSESPVDNAARRLGASLAVNPVGTAAFNTSSNVSRLRVTDVDESGLTTDFKDLTVTINNNVSPEKVIGKLGARFVNVGNLAVTVEGSVLFTNPQVPARIRANTAVTYDSIFVNADCGIAIDIPKLTLGGGGRELPVNETVQLSLTGDAFLDSTNSNIVFGISIFPNVPS